jgi:hypothetical protein
MRITALVLLLSGGVFVFSEPVVLTGTMVPSFLGKNITALRVTDHMGSPLPFQIDEVDSAGDYACPSGNEPTKGNGILDSADEIVFLWEDADTLDSCQGAGPGEKDLQGFLHCRITISHGRTNRYVYLTDDARIALSDSKYIRYDFKNEYVQTPYYYAAFGHDRFHFTKAGVMDFARDRFVDLTNELRVKIYFKALFGLLPISYSEQSVVCLVKRYKVGPVRLIRRGDFYLKLGFFIKGSRAAVNQICYPQMVTVPVYVHLPVRFKTWFTQAYIEMTPVIKTDANGFSFEVASHSLSLPLDQQKKTDTLILANPNHTCMTVNNGSLGYAWVLDAAMESRYLDGSGYVFRSPSDRKGIGYCGFRLTVRDLPKGYYLIANWVLFSKNSVPSLNEACGHVSDAARIAVANNVNSFSNQLTKAREYKNR